MTHLQQRLIQRSGFSINKESIKSLERRALINGLKTSEARGKLQEYLIKKQRSEHRFLRVYVGLCWVFVNQKNPIAITVIRIPSKLLKEQS